MPQSYNSARGYELPNQLLLSWSIKIPVTRKHSPGGSEIIQIRGGIDSRQFTAHSFKGAGLFSDYVKGPI